MSGSTIGGVVGGVIGAFFGPLGAQIGYVAGSLIGGYLDPQHLQGTRLGELRVQTVQEGSPRPIAYGQSEWYSGNVIQAGEPYIVVVEEEQGKGGGGPVIENEKAFLTYAVSFGEPGEIVALRRNGKVVMDLDNPGTVDAEAMVILSKLRRYNGSESQTPDPSLQALPESRGGGINQTPAYRGTAYIVVADDDVTQMEGGIPNWECRKASNATSTDTCSEHGLLAHWPLDDAAPGGTARELIQGLHGTYSNTLGVCTVEGRASLNSTGGGSTAFYYGDNMTALDCEVLTRTDGHWTCSSWFSLPEEWDSSQNTILGIGYSDNLSGRFGWGNFIFGGGSEVPAGGYNNSFTGSTSNVAYDEDVTVSAGSSHFICTTYDGEFIRMYLDGVLRATKESSGSGPTVSFVQVAGAFTGLPVIVQDVKLYNYALSAGEVSSRAAGAGEMIEAPDAPGVYVSYQGVIDQLCAITADIGEVTLDEVLLDIAWRAGVPPEMFDVEADTEVVVRGYLLTHPMEARAAIAPLRLAYFRDFPEYDGQIHSVPRGAAIVATILDSERLISDANKETRKHMIELPQRLDFFFADADANYAKVKVIAERESPNIPSTGTQQIECPMVFERSEAAQKASILFKCMTEESQGELEIDLPAWKFAYLVPSDCFEDERGIRWRIDRQEIAEGRMRIQAHRDRVSNYTSEADGGSVIDPSAPVSSLKGPSVLRVMNLPRLRSVDASPGVYLWVTGLLTAWPGADIYMQVDGTDVWVKMTTVTQRATIGRLTEEWGIGSSGEPLYVEIFDQRVLISSATAEQLANRANGFAVDTDGTAEIGQFANAVETTEHVYALTNIARAQLMTVEAEHDVGDAFVLLDSATRFLELDASLAGKTLHFLAVTRGTPFENNTDIQTIIFEPLFTGPENVQFYENENGEHYVDHNGTRYQVSS